MSITKLKENFSTNQLFAELADLQTRRAAAIDFARLHGAIDFVAFTWDVEIGRFLPANGFRKTFVGAKAWRNFLQSCADQGCCSSVIDGPASEPGVGVTGVALSSACICVFIHDAGLEPQAISEDARLLLTILSRLFEQERSVANLKEKQRAALTRIEELDEFASQLEGTRLEVNNALREAKVARSRSHNILNSITDAFISVNNEARILFANSSACDGVISADGGSIGRDLWEAVGPERQSVLRSAYARAKSLGSTVEFQLSDKMDGRHYEGYIYPSVDGASFLFRDISKRRDMERLVRELSTPVLHIEPRLVLVPLIGRLDAERVTQLSNNYTKAIREYRAKVGVIDVTGIADVDEGTVDGLTATIRAAGLLGCITILVGVTPAIARAFTFAGLNPHLCRAHVDLENGIKAGRGLIASEVISERPA